MSCGGGFGGGEGLGGYRLSHRMNLQSLNPEKNPDQSVR